MYLVHFLNKLFKNDGFILIDDKLNKFVIGKPKKEKPIEVKLLDKSLNYKLLLYPDLYFGEAYTDGSLIIQNGSLTDFLDLSFKNIGRSDINIYNKTLKKSTCMNILKITHNIHISPGTFNKIISGKYSTHMIRNIRKQEQFISPLKMQNPLE